jgi:hypothetical protein
LVFQPPQAQSQLFQLPDEVTLCVLYELFNQVDAQSEDICDVAMRTSALLVCRRLQQIMVDAPLIWSRINCEWPQILYDLYMLQAKGAPLTIRDKYTSTDPAEYLDLAKYIHLSYNGSTSVKPDKQIQINQTLNRGAAELEILTINLPCFDVDQALQLTSSFLGGDP